MDSPKDEILDIVDKNDVVIGQKLRAEIYQNNLHNFRTVNGFLINKERKLLILRRSATKRIFPLALDVGLGEHVLSGETYEEAFARGLGEELNLDINKIIYRQLGYLSPYADKVSSFMKTYEIQIEKVPKYNVNDFIEFLWLEPEKLWQKILNGEKTKDDLPKLLKIFYL